MILQLTQTRMRSWFVVFKIVAFPLLCLSLWMICSQASLAQSTKPLAKPPAHQSINLQSLPDISVLREDPENALRKGRLFYAISPRSEKALESLNPTATPLPVTIPIEVDRTNNSLYVWVRVDGHKYRLLLDTAGAPSVSIRAIEAQGLKLRGLHKAIEYGMQGEENVKEGLAQRMTLGPLTLGAIRVVYSPGHSAANKAGYEDVLGTKIFEKYRMTLNFAAKTMTLTRRGAPVAVPSDGTTLAVPFLNDPNKIFIPVRILDHPALALIDSGSGGNILSLSMAQFAAAKLPPSWSGSMVVNKNITIGDTHKQLTVLGLRVPVPVSVNTEQADSIQNKFNFTTTSQAGVSSIDERGPQHESTSMGNIPTGVILGTPFLLQFQRVTIDYPNHMLILQRPEHGAPVNVLASSSSPGTPWPGYQWQHSGDGWVEAPDTTAVNVPSIPLPTAATVGPVSSGGTTSTVDAPSGSMVIVNSGGGITVVTPSASPHTSSQATTETTITTVPQAGQGNTIVFINGTKYECPAGSTLRIEADGKAYIVAPGDANASSQKGK